MKNKILNLTIVIILTSTLSTLAQGNEIRYSDLSTQTKSKADYTSYVSKDGAVYKIGDKLRIGMPSSGKTFTFIWEGDGIIIPFTNIGANMSGLETEILKIATGGNKRTGFLVEVRTKSGANGLSNLSIQLENAIAAGEIKSFGMTSDEALAELKKAKDKLDLGLITQHTFDSLKVVFSKYIK